MENFIVKHYEGDKHPTIKGNGFDGLIVGEDREEAQAFIDCVNKQEAEIERINTSRMDALILLGKRDIEIQELEAKLKTLSDGIKGLKTYDMDPDGCGDFEMAEISENITDGLRGDYVETEDLMNILEKVEPGVGG